MRKPTCVQPEWLTTGVGYFCLRNVAFVALLCELDVKLDGVLFS